MFDVTQLVQRPCQLLIATNTFCLQVKAAGRRVLLQG
jgi:hypothetical protein